MSSKAMSLKAKIKNYAKSNNIAAQVVLQNYMFERFLARMSESEYKEKFVIKGGMLIAAIVTPLSIDVSTGDVITPSAVKYEFTGIFNTRPRDYYDIYILGTTQKYDKDLFKKALTATAIHRGSAEQISNTEEIIALISDSGEIKEMWRKYQKKFVYAQDIKYEQIMQTLRQLCQ